MNLLVNFPPAPVRILRDYTVAPLPSYKCCPLKGDRLLVTTWAIVLLVKHPSVTRRATGGAVATPTRGFPRMKSTPTGTRKQVAGGVDETATPRRTVMPAHRSRARSYRRPRNSQARFRGKGKGGRRPRRLQPQSNPRQSTSKTRKRTCGRLQESSCSRSGRMRQIFKGIGHVAP